jgi:hypothetical protein
MKKSRKLRLAKETVRNLNDKTLVQVNGGATNYPNYCMQTVYACGTERCESAEFACISNDSACGTSGN